METKKKWKRLPTPKWTGGPITPIPKNSEIKHISKKSKPVFARSMCYMMFNMNDTNDDINNIETLWDNWRKTIRKSNRLANKTLDRSNSKRDKDRVKGYFLPKRARSCPPPGVDVRFNNFRLHTCKNRACIFCYYRAVARLREKVRNAYLAFDSKPAVFIARFKSSKTKPRFVYSVEGVYGGCITNTPPIGAYSRRYAIILAEPGYEYTSDKAYFKEITEVNPVDAAFKITTKLPSSYVTSKLGYARAVIWYDSEEGRNFRSGYPFGCCRDKPGQFALGTPEPILYQPKEPVPVSTGWGLPV